MSFRKAFSFSAIESIGSRIFDLLTLWIVLNTLNTDDIAKFGLATSAIFVFNLFLVAPETALFKFQKTWQQDGRISEFLSAFFSFSVLKIALHYILALVVWLYVGEFNWFFYAVVFSAITQQIQAAEICRIYQRMELQQRKVALFELASKSVLMLLCCFLFFYASVELYFFIYAIWSLSVAGIWVSKLSYYVKFRISFSKSHISHVFTSMVGYSLWSHISGVMTIFIYNSNVLFLKWNHIDLDSIALFTVVNKVANLFFVIPMFFQSFVPVILANSGMDEERQFNKILLISALLSVAQFVFFFLFGSSLGILFGLSSDFDSHRFYQLGLIVCTGILFLNLSRPISTFLLIKSKPRKVLLNIFIPATLTAMIGYPLCIRFYQLDGAAWGNAAVYLLLATLLFIQFFRYRRNLE